jgi:hypothetical protein
LATGLGKGQIAELVEDNEVEARQIIGKPPLAAGAGLAFQPIDEVDDGVEAAPGTATDTSPSDSDSDGKMALAGAGSADQYGVALLGDEAAGGELADQTHYVGNVDPTLDRLERHISGSGKTPHHHK